MIDKPQATSHAVDDDSEGIDLDAVCRALTSPTVLPQLLEALAAAARRDAGLDGCESIAEIADRLVGRLDGQHRPN